MKRILTTISAVLLMALVSVSCNKDNESKYPATIVTGCWSGNNGTVGQNCEVTFTNGNTPAQTLCTITLINPGEKNPMVVQAPFTYDAATGTVKMPMTAGQSSVLISLQFNSEGNLLTLDSTPRPANMKPYTLSRTPFPGALAGHWLNHTIPALTIDFVLETAIVAGSQQCHLDIFEKNHLLSLPGQCIYDPKKGLGTFNLEFQDSTRPGTFTYNIADNTLTIVCTELNIDNTVSVYIAPIL